MFAPYAYTPSAQTRSTESITASDSVDFDDGAPDGEVSLNLGSPAPTPSAPRDWTQTEVDREFFAIVTDQIATPTALLDPLTGEVAGHAARTLYGEHTWVGSSTLWAFPGQYVDRESVLHYNRHRYYNPGTGRYTSPDPLGLAPAPNPHTYPANPAVWADPLGLAPTDGCENSGARNRGGSQVPLTSPQQRDLARWNGMSPHPSLSSHGQPVFRDGKRVVSYDRDSHNGGVWKVFKNERAFRNDNRQGTYNFDLTERVGD